MALIGIFQFHNWTCYWWYSWRHLDPDPNILVSNVDHIPIVGATQLRSKDTLLFQRHNKYPIPLQDPRQM